MWLYVELKPKPPTDQQISKEKKMLQDAFNFDKFQFLNYFSESSFWCYV